MEALLALRFFRSFSGQRPAFIRPLPLPPLLALLCCPDKIESGDGYETRIKGTKPLSQRSQSLDLLPWQRNTRDSLADFCSSWAWPGGWPGPAKSPRCHRGWRRRQRHGTAARPRKTTDKTKQQQHRAGTPRSGGLCAGLRALSPRPLRV